MEPRGSRFNPKRRILSAADAARLHEVLHQFATAVQYGGNPEHKRSAGDFGLTPPAAPRPGKTLCDAVDVFRRADALRLLREGLRRGLVDARWSGTGWPQLIWAVTAEGVPAEAQRESDGLYHGYPMPSVDPLREAVLERWGTTP